VSGLADGNPSSRLIIEQARELAKAIIDFTENEAPAEEWDGGSLGYSLGGIWQMATDLLKATE